MVRACSHPPRGMRRGQVVGVADPRGHCCCRAPCANTRRLRAGAAGDGGSPGHLCIIHDVHTSAAPRRRRPPVARAATPPPPPGQVAHNAGLPAPRPLRSLDAAVTGGGWGRPRRARLDAPPCTRSSLSLAGYLWPAAWVAGRRVMGAGAPLRRQPGSTGPRVIPSSLWRGVAGRKEGEGARPLPLPRRVECSRWPCIQLPPFRRRHAAERI